MRFALPIACTPGRTCWITKHVDVDPGPGDQDYACGRLTQDGHRGTDIGLRDMTVAARGVAVLAAAAGTVSATRDGVADVNSQRLTKAEREALSSRGCGNAVVLDHGAGWQTMYCHMKAGSIRVRSGERVSAGTPLGQVGLSGLTEHPHLHFGVRKDGDVVDPFRGLGEAEATCGLGSAPLWTAATLDALPYQPLVLNNFGIAPERPDRLDSRDGRYADDTVPETAPVLVAWIDAFGLEAGDTIHISLTGPGGDRVVDTTRTVERELLQIFTFSGRRLTETRRSWAVGDYALRVALTRSGPGQGGDAGPAPVRVVGARTVRVVPAEAMGSAAE